MAQKKPHEVDRWLARPDKAMSTVLLYGPDHGLVSERGRSFAKNTGVPVDDPFAVIRLDATELESDPGRLIDEADTVAMFGGDRLIWVRNVGAHKGIADAVKQLTGRRLVATTVLIEAGDLKKTAALRSAVEASAHGMALPCFADDARAVDDLIASVLRAEGLKIADDTLHLLKRSLGGDRMASRSELDKLALFCGGKQTVEIADIVASVGDVSNTTADDVIDAVLTGQFASVDAALARLENAGGSTQQLLATAIRQFQMIQQFRHAVDREGKSPATAVAAARPPVFYARRGSIENVVGRLDTAATGRILERLQIATLDSRRRPALDFSIVRQSLLAIASEVARSGQ